MENNKFKIEIVDIICDKEDIKNIDWLYKNIPWINHDSKIVRASFNDIITGYYIILNEFRDEPSVLNKMEFDSVIIRCAHSFSGNHYDFEFKLNDKTIFITSDSYSFGYTEENTKQSCIEYLSQKVNGYKTQIFNIEKLIEDIKIL